MNREGLVDTGTGPAVVLLHGFPHTPRLWDAVLPRLAQTHRVIAPNLVAGGDGQALAAAVADLLDGLGIERADVVGIDAGAPPSFILALSRPERVRRLVLMESLLGRLPGAESFLANGPPWWFGFHQAPGLAETVLEGHEREYIEWFLRAGTHGGRGVAPEIRHAFVSAYTGRTALASAFAHYRALPVTAAQIASLVVEQGRRLSMPVLAIGAHPIGPALAAQLRPVASNLTEVQLENCGHIIPLDAPGPLLEVLVPFLLTPGLKDS
ncbi:alpha/beta fold hydrolase [Stigmatella hybrida]|uniref:alpha/beta fold hydrolase n=1 Tax=Stigmatella hybrida TaxID=394097 RepID=UPI001CDB1047|nr:alpha/beta hydrolase [Stigmatella hybrida]